MYKEIGSVQIFNNITSFPLSILSLFSLYFAPSLLPSLPVFFPPFSISSTLSLLTSIPLHTPLSFIAISPLTPLSLSFSPISLLTLSYLLLPLFPFIHMFCENSLVIYITHMFAVRICYFYYFPI